ncbi:CarD family transcriptional regulator [Roseicella sp. DB1501]|nr:CarD family transcriptional regulator [Roseicella sp. DB1501]
MHKPVASAAAGRAAEAGRATAAQLAPSTPLATPLATSSPAPAPPAATKPAPPGLAEAQAAPPLPAAVPRVGSPGHSPAAPGRVGGPHSPPPRQPAKPVEFKTGDHVVYPTHGVGTVQGIESMSAAGHTLQVIVVTFDENRMTLRVPVNKAASSGLRKLATDGAMKDALDTLRGKARIKRTMWSRRAQEYEAKINSGDPVAIAEVVRDLHRNAGQPDQSFSERQIYEQAMDRLAAELAAIDRTDKVQATDKLLLHLKQG